MFFYPLFLHPLALVAVFHTAYFTIKAQGAADVPRPALVAVSDRPPQELAEEVVAALFHRLVGVHEVLAVGGGVAVVRDELHGLAEIGLVVVGLGVGDAFTNRSKVPRLTLSDAKDPI